MTMTDDDLDRLLVDAGHELDALSLDWNGPALTTMARRRVRRVVPVALAASLVVALATGLVVTLRDDAGTPGATTLDGSVPVATTLALASATTVARVVGPESLPFEMIGELPDGFEPESASEATLQGLDPPTMQLGWEQAPGEYVPILVARTDLLARDFPDGPVDERTVTDDAGTDGLISGGSRYGSTAGTFTRDDISVSLLTPTGDVPDAVLLEIAAAFEPDAATLELSRELPDGVRQFTARVGATRVHEVWYSGPGRVSIAFATLTGPVEWDGPAPGAVISDAAVAGRPATQWFQPGTGAESYWRYWTGADGVTRSLMVDVPNGVDPEPYFRVAASIRPATDDERALFVDLDR